MGDPGTEFIRLMIKPEYEQYLSRLRNIITSPSYMCVRACDSEFPLGVVADSLITSLSIEKTQGESKDTPRRDFRAIQGLEFP